MTIHQENSSISYVSIHKILKDDNVKNVYKERDYFHETCTYYI